MEKPVRYNLIVATEGFPNEMFASRCVMVQRDLPDWESRWDTAAAVPPPAQMPSPKASKIRLFILVNAKNIQKNKNAIPPNNEKQKSIFENNDSKLLFDVF